MGGGGGGGEGGLRLYMILDSYSRISEKWAHWEQAFCPLYGGCPITEAETKWVDP